uniref:OmpA-like domain-containing protein n=1 Tax=Haptolina ericina TaxID=156174 RepID=A0A7S3F4K3_9EUKA
MRSQIRPEAAPPASIGGIRGYGAAEVRFRVIQSLLLPRALGFGAEEVSLPAAGQPLLEKVVETLRQHPSLDIVVEGHADKTEARAETLSARRADAVKRWLVAHGARCNVTTVGFGTACPVATNLTFQGRRHNRRVELQIRPQGG